MSTILDALRRLQRDREGDTGDSRAAPSGPGRHGRGAPRALFVLVALGIVAVAGGWYYLSDGDPEDAEQASAEPAPGRPLARRSEPPGAAAQTIEEVPTRRARPPLPEAEPEEYDDPTYGRPPITPAAEKVLRKRAASQGITYKEMVKQYMAIRPPPPPPVPDRIVVSSEDAMTERDVAEVERMFAEMDEGFAASGEPTTGELLPKNTLPLREIYSRTEVDPSLPGPDDVRSPARAGKGTATVKVVSEPPARTTATREPAPVREVEPTPTPPAPKAAPQPEAAKVARSEPPVRPTPKAPEPKAPAPEPSATAPTPLEASPSPSTFPHVVVQSVRWHPDPERRVVWLEVEQTGARELQEGDIVGGVMIRRINPSGVELQVGDVRKQVSVGR